MRPRRDVVDALRQRIISGRYFGTLAPDGRLPSARTLAAELRADPRVVVAAYRALEREGLVERRPPSRGFFTRPLDDGSSATRPSRRGTAAGGVRARDPVDDLLVECLVLALERDVSLATFAHEARRAVDTLPLRAACIECNRDQMVWLCRELQEDYGFLATGVELDDVQPLVEEPATHGAPLRAPAQLRDADLLVTTASHAPAVEAVARTLGKPHVVVAWREDLRREVDRLLEQEPVYFVGTDPRFADKIRRDFAAHPDRERALAALVGDDGRVALPPGAAAYVMRTARDRLGGIPEGVRALSTLRAFSADTRARLVRFIVRRNRAAARAAAGVPME